MQLVLIGPPGSGKGTVSHSLATKHQWQHISTGDIIRSHVKRETELGLQVKEIQKRGDLVSDALMQDLVKATIIEMNNTNTGFILDGFPRTTGQTEWFIKHFTIDFYIFFEISDNTIIERISGRRIHEASGRIYNVTYSPPKIEGKDDITGEPLIQRVDDMPDKIAKRLQVYKTQTFPIIELIQSQKNNYITIDGENTEEEVLATIESQIFK